MSVIGHGVDLVDIARVAAIVDRHGIRFIERVFTREEQAYAEAAPRLRGERYAARFAAKEAVFKVLGTGWAGGVDWRDVEVARTGAGAPILRVTGHAAAVADRLGITGWHVSLSHTRELASASVIAVGHCRPPCRPS